MSIETFVVTSGVSESRRGVWMMVCDLSIGELRTSAWIGVSDSSRVASSVKVFILMIVAGRFLHFVRRESWSV
jgi:hypothetical protein